MRKNIDGRLANLGGTHPFVAVPAWRGLRAPLAGHVAAAAAEGQLTDMRRRQLHECFCDHVTTRGEQMVIVQRVEVNMGIFCIIVPLPLPSPVCEDGSP